MPAGPLESEPPRDHRPQGVVPTQVRSRCRSGTTPAPGRPPQPRTATFVARHAPPGPRGSARQYVLRQRGDFLRCWALPVPASSGRSEEHTSELQSLMRISYAVFCLKKKKTHYTIVIQTVPCIIYSKYNEMHTNR